MPRLASSLTMPFCGPNLGSEPVGWHRERNPLPCCRCAGRHRQRHARVWPAGAGLARPQRFDATMGTDFLSRMAGLASAALQRLK